MMGNQMALKIVGTDRQVATIRQGTGRVAKVRNVPSMYVKRSSAGVLSFALATRDPANGKHSPGDLKIGDHPSWSLSEAIDEAREMKRRVTQGLPARKLKETLGAITIESNCEDWLADDSKRGGAKLARRDDVRSALRRLAYPKIGNRTLDQNTLAALPAEIDELLLDVARKKGGIAANRLHSYLRRPLQWAVERRRIPYNPMAGVLKPSEERSRDRVLGKSELRTLWNTFDVMGLTYSAAAKVMMLTGARRGEISGMRWPEIDLAEAVWQLPSARTKNGRPVAIPLPTQAVEILTTLPRFADDLVFSTGRPSDGLSGWGKPKARIDAAVQLDAPWTWHDLRRSLATGWAEELGATADAIEAQLNHVSGTRAGIAGIYNRSSLIQQRRALVQKWADLIEGIDADNVVEIGAA